MPELYDTLGIEEKASKRAIKSAFRELAKKHHPDRDGGDLDKFKKIQHAYMVLYNDTSRETYDRDGVVHSAAASNKAGLAYSTLAALFTQALESNLDNLETVDLVEICRKQISANVSDAGQTISKLKKRLVRLVLAQKKLHKKASTKVKPQNAREDILESVINEQIDNSKKTIKQMHDKIAMCKFMDTIIEDYTYQVDKPEGLAGESGFSGTFATSTSAFT